MIEFTSLSKVPEDVNARFEGLLREFIVVGGIYENLISEMLIKRGYSLNYYKTGNSSMEIEFLIERNGGVVPVEVKAGNTASVSLNNYMEQFHPAEAYKFIDGNIGTTGGKISLPHYMAMFL